MVAGMTVELGPNALVAVMAAIAIVQLVVNQVTTKRAGDAAAHAAAQLTPNGGSSTLDKINTLVDAATRAEQLANEVAATVASVNERLIVVEADAHSNARAAAVAAGSSTPLPPPPPPDKAA